MIYSDILHPTVRCLEIWEEDLMHSREYIYLHNPLKNIDKAFIVIVEVNESLD